MPRKTAYIAAFIGLVVYLTLANSYGRPALAEYRQGTDLTWTHLSSVNGDLPAPSNSTQQTSSLILDINKDGLNDFVISARRDPGPSLVWYRRGASGWTKYVIDDQILPIEAGGTFHDIDGDDDLDVVMGGDSGSNEVWWWENPYPNYAPSTTWTRRLIKQSGGGKHHDQMFGDFDKDGKAELVFWNQHDQRLVLTEIPSDPKDGSPWTLNTIYTWSSGSEHEGLAQADIDGDGKQDIVGGGRWFKHNGGTSYTPNIIDSGQTFSRAAAGQLKKGGRSEVVFVIGDGVGRLKWYEWNGSQWIGKDLLGFDVDHGHSLQIEDVDADGNLDIFVGEMRLNGGNADAKTWIFFGDGNGNFSKSEVASGFGHHESKLGDLDGNYSIDILGKPFNWDTPRVDIWLNGDDGQPPSPTSVPPEDPWLRHAIDMARPWRSIFVTAADLDGDKLSDIVTGAWWYENPGTMGGAWTRHTIGDPLNNMATIYDFDGDGDVDILGTQGKGSDANSSMVWAQNDGKGNFTIRQNIAQADGTFLQGAAAAIFVKNGSKEIALSWHYSDYGVQMLTVPADPVKDEWTWREISSFSEGEELSAADIDRDGDGDLLLGTKWLRNDVGQMTTNSSGPWSVQTITTGQPAEPDRNRLADINKDGRLDAVIGYEVIQSPGKLAWYEQPVTATNIWTEHEIDNLYGPMSLAATDMDDDGDVDVVVGEHGEPPGNGGSRLFVYENTDGKGGSWSKQLVHAGDEHHDGAQAADLDNDGNVDIFSIGWNHSNTLVYENNLQDEITPTPDPSSTPDATVTPGPASTPKPPPGPYREFLPVVPR